MQRFELLEIQKNFEEKRLIFGKKLEEFLRVKTQIFLQKIDQVLAAKNFSFFSISIIFFLSIFLRSRLDIGGDSAVYIDLAGKMSRGEKYYFDFYEQNFPLAFWFHLIPFFAAKFFSIHPIISAEIFVNFLGLWSLFFSRQILGKSRLSQTHQNLIIKAFAIGLFLQFFTLQSNDFLTKGSFFLIFTFPYLSFSFPRKSPLSKKELIYRGCLMGLIPCLKPHYLVLIIFIELSLPVILDLRKASRGSCKFESGSLVSKDPRFCFTKPRMTRINWLFTLDKLVMLLIGLLYLVLMIKFTPEFFEFIVPIASSVYPSYQKSFFINLTLTHLHSKILFFSGVFLVFLRQKFSPEDKILFLIFCSASTILLIENMVGDERFFSLITIVSVKIFYDFLKSKEFDFDKNKLIICLFLLSLLFDPKTTMELKGVLALWWIIFPISFFLLLKKLSEEKLLLWDKKTKTKWVFFSLLFFALLVATSTKISTNQENFLVFSSVIFLSLLFIYEKIYAKFYLKFSLLFVIVQFFLMLSLISTYLFSISQAYQGSSLFKSPNFLSSNIINYTGPRLLGKQDQILILSYWIHESSQPLIYLGLKNEMIGTTAGYLYSGPPRFNSKQISENKRFALDYFFADLKKNLADQNTKILFILNSMDDCQISFLEHYFQDQEFKKIFLKNYHFAGRIFAAKEIEKFPSVSFFAEKPDPFRNLDLARKRPLYNFEIYERNEGE